MLQLNTQLLLIALFSPFIGAVFVGFAGTRFASHLLSRRAGKLLTVLGVAVSFVCSAIALMHVMNGQSYHQTLYCWMNIAQTQISLGFMIDSLSAMMMTVVTFISLLVHLYSIGYMDDDDNICRFFAYISLFTFSMLALVMGNNFLMLFFGWEAVGVMSYLLIGFWLDKPSAVGAGLKAFLVNRIGDFGFVIGVALVFAYSKSLDYVDVFAARTEFAHMLLPGSDMFVVTAICLFLFVGAMGKSAQFPLHVWLPDSMEGPTPISALIHAATMVTAGIFMVARLSPLYEMSHTALTVIIVVGAISALLLGIVAMVQRDIKRIIAFSTLSQLGYMVVGLGASAYSVAVFHLMTHAFFKALLFLVAGSVILAMHHDQDTRHMGGLWRYMPVTYVSACIGALALAGAPFFSGFYSKESIIGVVRASTIPGATFAATCVILGLFITGFYTFRFLFIVFHGRKRFQRIQNAHLSDVQCDEHENTHPPKESPIIMLVALVLLAIPSLCIGFLTIGPMIYGEYFSGTLYIDLLSHGAMAQMASHFSSAWAMTWHEICTPTFWLAVAGALFAWYCYIVNPVFPVRLARSSRFLYRLVYNQYYLNEVYQKVIVNNVLRLGNFLWVCIDKGLIDQVIIEAICVKGTKRLAHVLWKVGDLFVIDGFIVNGCAKFIGWIASIVRHFQSGLVYHYVFVMIVGVLCMLSWFIPMSLK